MTVKGTVIAPQNDNLEATAFLVILSVARKGAVERISINLKGKAYTMYYVYIITNSTRSVVYIGITNNLQRRLYEHKHKIIEGFSSKYNVHKLVYYETTNDITTAIQREKQLKGWRRAKKNALIESINPQWLDLMEECE